MMATQKRNKKDSNLTDLFVETLAKKQRPARKLGSDLGGGSGDGTVEKDANPVTKAFMEQLFGVLRKDLPALRQESRRSNIRIRGVPAQGIMGPLEYFVIRLFKHVASALDDQDIILDRTHRTGRPSQSPGQPQDILMCLHYYKRKELDIGP
ncbi:hypothetical protein NDU88_008555 [Pleurodeles waltl]|uniref:Uncharacterized protein n=1 Tax=Pleurodeles waltl TaxID=8319 RepID=A0AAV7RWF6_PLEWA|nr:hypothetical protein NDU88_008555 [Pleurodeles waltl]